MEIALYYRSGATRKSGGAERSGAERSGERSGVAEKRWSGAERGAGGRGAGTERGAEVTGLGWSVEQLFRQSPAPLRSHALGWNVRTGSPSLYSFTYLLAVCCRLVLPSGELIRKKMFRIIMSKSM